MSFKKLALVTAMFAATSGAYAMEAMDEEALAAATGQDGITVTITTPASGITMTQIIHDNDGHAGNANSGAIVIGDPADPTNTTAGGPAPMKIVLGGALTLTIDADGGDATPVAAGQTGAYLNIAVGLTGTTTINTGDLSVMDSGSTGAAGSGFGTVTAAGSTILKDMQIVLGATSLNVQLGAEPQGAMIKMNSAIGNGLTLNNFELVDAGGAFTGGSVFMASQHIYNAGNNTLLNVAADIDVTNTGLRVALSQFGHATNGASIDITGVRLGDAAQANIGDIEIRGLNLNGTGITIAGH